MDTTLPALITLFNAGKTDLPDGALHKNCVFRLNGCAYHEHLGRPPDDPIVRLVGCGPAGYRFILTAIRYALSAPKVMLYDEHAADRRHGRDDVELTRRATLSGVLRGGHQPFRAECELVVREDLHGSIREIAVTMGDPDVELIMTARRR
jgi:hypothetical protein